MNLAEIVDRTPPVPWNGDYKIPWHEPAFSKRMLREHLDQTHSQASRPQTIIEKQIDFLEKKVFNGEVGKILDLGCGPGFYCKSLAERGHTCLGIDFSPAAIEYARTADTRSDYQMVDVRSTDLPNSFDLVLMTYGEFNAFNPSEAELLIKKMHDAAWPNGTIVLEVHDEQAIRKLGNASPAWQALQRSVFSDEPHIWFSENFWHEEELTAIRRHYVLSENVLSENVLSKKEQPAAYINTLKGYRQHDYVSMLQNNGFRRIAVSPSLSADPGLFFLIAAT
ncbi:MAG: methyltransferase domain-containing protein [Pseudomonadota bacterium]